jgi:photosynthetic reaction center H subunit
MGAQFADAPLLANPDQVTLREEDRIAAFFAGGTLFADPRRVEPLL